MAMDYGARRRPDRRTMIVAAAVLGFLAIGALVFVWANDRASNMAHARAWTVNGPACPLATLPPSASDAPLQVESFQGVTFARAHGAIACAVINADSGRGADSFPICQFDHPGRLTVTTSRGTTQYQLSPLIGATVSVEHAIPRCVLGTSRAVG